MTVIVRSVKGGERMRNHVVTWWGVTHDKYFMEIDAVSGIEKVWDRVTRGLGIEPTCDL